MELEQIEKNKIYTWKNPKTKKSEDVKGERIAAYKINYPNEVIKITEKKEPKPKSENQENK